MIRDGSGIYRYFRGSSGHRFREVLSSAGYQSIALSGRIIESEIVESDARPDLYEGYPDVSLVLRHPTVPFISYSYEWPFEMLRTAAKLQLELLQEAFEQGLMIKDATASNIQFEGDRPIFIDVASFETYQDGEPWVGYAQFCRNFLNPLLLQAYTGAPYQPLLRAMSDGIEPGYLKRLLPLRSKLHWGVFLDVVAQSWMGAGPSPGNAIQPSRSKPRIPKSTLQKISGRLGRTIDGLKRKPGKSTWSEYEATKSHYQPAAENFKESFVKAALQYRRPETVWDLGCNTGQYSLLASEFADHVLAMDSDELSVGILFEKLSGRKTNILPLVVDILNPSPGQGWAGTERRALTDRGHADLTLCLALIHHLALTGNVPLPMISSWLARTSRAAVVEFVPKTDPMSRRLLVTKQDVFEDYTVEAFERCLEQDFRIIGRGQIPESERVLYSIESK